MKKADEDTVEKEILEAFRGGEKSVSKVYSDLKENGAAKRDTTLRNILANSQEAI